MARRLRSNTSLRMRGSSPANTSNARRTSHALAASWTVISSRNSNDQAVPDERTGDSRRCQRSGSQILRSESATSLTRPADLASPIAQPHGVLSWISHFRSGNRTGSVPRHHEGGSRPRRRGRRPHDSGRGLHPEGSWRGAREVGTPLPRRVNRPRVGSHHQQDPVVDLLREVGRPGS